MSVRKTYRFQSDSEACVVAVGPSTAFSDFHKRSTKAFVCVDCGQTKAIQSFD
jgi:hypothetical protein